jgi:hypothetical protein
MKKIDWVILFCIVIISIFTLKDLFKPGFYTSHDGIHQIARLFYFDQALQDGQIPPRWAGGLLNGFGYPLFIFSYHMPWLIAEPMHLAGLSIIDSVKMTFLVGFIFSGIAMYLYQKELFGRIAAVAGTVIYLYAPNRFLDIFVRAAIGDATAYIFPPLIFLALYKFRQSGRIRWQWVAVGAIAYASLLLSHAMVFILVSMSIGIYILYWLCLTKYKKQLFIGGLLILALGVGLSAYYFIPSMIERDITIFNRVMGSAFTGMTFVDFRKLVYSPWGYGAMFAAAGAMSLQLGIAQWVVCVFAVLVMSIYVFIRKRTKEAKPLLLEGAFFLMLFILSVIAMLPVSLPFWKLINSIIVIDFTWRIMPVVIFAVAMLAGLIIRLVPYQIPVTIFIVLLAFYSNRNHIHINESVNWSVPFYLSLEKTTNSFDEYTPKGVNDELVSKKREKVQISNHDAIIKLQKNISNLTEFQAISPEKASIQLNTLYYPGWNVKVNGKNTNIRNESGVIAFDIGKGTSTIVATFSETSLRKISDLITVLSSCIVLWCLVQYRKI